MLFLSIEGYWRNLLMFLCEPIYKLIVILYELFEVIGTADILSSDILSVLYSRIGSLLGVYMMFRIIFSCIQMLINPDYVSDKEKGFGKIIFKVFMTILLLAITPFIFEKAFELQNLIVGVNGDGNIIAKIVLPNQDSEAYKDFGPQLSAYVFTNFYRYTDDVPEGKKTCALFDENGEAGINSSLHKAIITTRGNVKSAKICLDDSWEVGNQENYAISFTSNGLFAVIIGLVICYVLLMYTLMVGARVIQLAFLRIISPMAILGYLSPKKDGMFEKWLKMCTTTYLDLFIRMAIIYFVVFMISLIIGNYNGIALAKDYDQMWIVNIVMILALLLFAKKAPELLKELFPKSGVASLGFGVKSPKGLLNDMLGGNILSKGYDKAIGYTKRGAKAVTAGALLGLGTGGISAISRYRANRHNGKNIGRSLLGATGGAFGGFYRGVKVGSAKGSVFANASKGYKEQRTADDKYDQLITSGGSTIGKVRSTLTSFIGETKGQTYTRQLNNMDVLSGFKKDIQSYADEITFVKSAKDAWTNIVQMHGETSEEFQARKEVARKRYKAYQKAVIDATLADPRNQIRNAAGDLQFVVEYKDEKGNDIKRVEYLSDADDKTQSYAIDVKRTEANGFVSSHQVEVWNLETNQYERIESISNRDDIEQAVTKASATKTHIYSEDDYNRSIANDKAAGVDSNATVNKK